MFRPGRFRELLDDVKSDLYERTAAIDPHGPSGSDACHAQQLCVSSVKNLISHERRPLREADAGQSTTGSIRDLWVAVGILDQASAIPMLTRAAGLATFVASI